MNVSDEDPLNTSLPIVLVDSEHEERSSEIPVHLTSSSRGSIILDALLEGRPV